MTRVMWVVYKGQVIMVVILTYQLYLALTSETVDAALNDIERVGHWPVQVLNIGLFVVVLAICWFYLRSTRADLDKLQKLNDDERREYSSSLKEMLSQHGKVLERNNVIFERIDRYLERLDDSRKG
jgi:cytochrome c biogenesis factor